MRKYCTTKKHIYLAKREKHEMTGTRLYRIWNSMKNRCSNPDTNSYKYYGAKGITVCDLWKLSFMTFYNWAMENGYRDDLTIDRIDSTLGYSPENCRWATVVEQKRNRPGFVHMITYDGKTQCLADWVRELKICRSTHYKMMKRGMSDLEALQYCISLKGDLKQ